MVVDSGLCSVFGSGNAAGVLGATMARPHPAHVQFLRLIKWYTVWNKPHSMQNLLGRN